MLISSLFSHISFCAWLERRGERLVGEFEHGSWPSDAAVFGTAFGFDRGGVCVEQCHVVCHYQSIGYYYREAVAART